MIIKLICSVCQDNFVTIKTDDNLSDERIERISYEYSCGKPECAADEDYKTQINIEV
jgi:hypothetical protein